MATNGKSESSIENEATEFDEYLEILFLFDKYLNSEGLSKLKIRRELEGTYKQHYISIRIERT